MGENQEIDIYQNSNFQISTELADLSKLANQYASQSRAKNTIKAYRSDWEDFDRWCAQKGFRSLPADPNVVSIYIADRAANSFIDANGKERTSLKVASLRRRLSAINQVHAVAGKPFDQRHHAIRETWKGIKNVHGTAQAAKEPILIEDLRKMIEAIEIDGKNRMLGLRDRALLLIGFAGAFRRSEIVSLHVKDMKFAREGIVVNLKRSKTDQEGSGRQIAIPYGSNPLTCPVRALQDWLDISRIDEGPLFRYVDRHGNIAENALTADSVALIIKRNLHLEGREAIFSGHSLRAGFVTTTAIAGVPEHLIMKQTGHKRSDTLKKYIRLGELWKENAAQKAGL